MFLAIIDDLLIVAFSISRYFNRQELSSEAKNLQDGIKFYSTRVIYLVATRIILSWVNSN